MSAHPTPLPLNITTANEYEDPFSVGDLQASFHFSPEALREELANIHLPVSDFLETNDETQEYTHAPQSDLQEIYEALPSITIGGAARILQRDTPSRSPSRSGPPTGTRDSFEQLPISPTEPSFDNISIGPAENIQSSSGPALSIGASSALPSTPSSSPTEPHTPASEIEPATLRTALTSTTSPLPEVSSSSPVALQKSTTDFAVRPPIQRQARSAGPSVFEKVMSRTRPVHLPPKSKQEDTMHLSTWGNMMKMSQQAEKKRRQALQERRLRREKEIEDSIQQWQREIVPDWRAVHKNTVLRKLWWRGIPTKLRAQMWQHAVGNPLALSKDHYRICLSRAKRTLTSGTFPAATLSLIEEDILGTLPSLHIFHPNSGPLYPDLKDMLCAWVVSRSDEGLGYTSGAAKIAAMMLINMPAQQGFNVMKNLLERHCLRSFYGGDAAREDVEAYYRIFDTLLADGMPKIYFNFKQHHISPSAYLPDWLLSLFLDHLPFETCARIWDVFVLEGDAFLYRAALGILAVLEPRLFFPDRKELLEVLKGENKAARSVAQREHQSLEGGKYEIYGVDEETLWERIESMNDWWKEGTWRRLIQRELPDI